MNNILVILEVLHNKQNVIYTIPRCLIKIIIQITQCYKMKVMKSAPDQTYPF